MRKTPFGEFYDIREVAEMLGVSVVTVRRLYREGIIKGAPLRGTSRPILFKEEDIKAAFECD